MADTVIANNLFWDRWKMEMERFEIVDDPHGILAGRSVYYSFDGEDDEVQKY